MAANIKQPKYISLNLFEGNLGMMHLRDLARLQGIEPRRRSALETNPVTQTEALYGLC